LIASFILSVACRAMFITLYHNMISVFLLTSAILLLINGLKNKNLYYIFVAGLLIGINSFTRLPNIVLSLLALLPIVDCLYKRIDLRDGIKRALIVFAGCCVGILFVFILMLILGHTKIFFNSFLSGIDLTEGGHSTHSLGNMLWNYCGSYYYILLSLLIFAVSYIYYAVIGRCCRVWLKYVFGYIYIILIPILCYFLLGGFLSMIAASYYALTFIASYALLKSKNVNSDLKLIVIGCLSVIVLLPLGTDGYFNLTVDTTILSCPIILCFAEEARKENKSLIFNVNRLNFLWLNSGKLMLNVVFVSLVCLFLLSSFYWVRQTHGDLSWIWNKKYKIDNVLVGGIYTSKKNADMIIKGMAISDKYVNENDYLIIYPYPPILHYLTKTRPYIPCSWLWCYKDEELLKVKIAESENRIDGLPVVMMPSVVNIDGNIYKQFTWRKNWQAMRNFLMRHNYGLIDRNEYFVILLPNSSDPIKFSE
ncbi:MAG: hypothetical protein RR341_06105, partial [Bacteroidales bacterium]